MRIGGKEKNMKKSCLFHALLKLCYCRISPNKSGPSNSFFFMLTSVLLFVRLYAFT